FPAAEEVQQAAVRAERQSCLQQIRRRQAHLATGAQIPDDDGGMLRDEPGQRLYQLITILRRQRRLLDRQGRRANLVVIGNLEVGNLRQRRGERRRHARQVSDLRARRVVFQDLRSARGLETGFVDEELAVRAETA